MTRYLCCLLSVFAMSCSPGSSKTDAAPPVDSTTGTDAGHPTVFAAGNTAYPIGPAGGALIGTYPNPGIDAAAIPSSSIEAGANWTTYQTIDGAPRFAAPSPMAWNALTFGCDPTGAVTSTACITAMMSARTALGGGCLYFPGISGGAAYLIDVKFTETFNGACWLGDNSSTIRVKTGSGLDAALSVKATGVTMRGLTWDGNSATIDDILFQGASGFTADHVTVMGAQSEGFHSASAVDTTFSSVTQTDGGAVTVPTVSGLLQIGEVVNPWKPYDLEIMGSGALGTATVRFSDDNGVDWSGTYTIQSNGIFQPPFVETASNNPAAPSASGLRVIFPAQTYTSGQVFQFTPAVSAIADNSAMSFNDCTGTLNGKVWHTSGMPGFWSGGVPLAVTPGSVTVASANVVGVSTAFLATNARPGDWFTYYAASAWWPVQILAVIDDTHLTLASPVPFAGGGSGLDFAISQGSGWYGEVFVEYSAGDVIKGGTWALNGGVGLKLDSREGLEVIAPYTNFNGAGGFSIGTALSGTKPIGMNVRGLESDQDALFGGALQQGQNVLVQSRMIAAGINQGPQYTSWSGGVYGRIDGMISYNDTTGSSTVLNNGGVETVTNYVASTIVLPVLVARATSDNAGTMAMRKTQLNLSGGANGNISTHQRSVVEFVPSAAATVAGISFDGTAVAEIGQIIYWSNTSTVYPVTLLHISGSSLGTNAFHSPSGADWVAPPGSAGTFRYLDGLIGGTGAGWLIEVQDPTITHDASGNAFYGITGTAQSFFGYSGNYVLFNGSGGFLSCNGYAEENLTVGGSSADFGGGVGLLNFAPVTTAPSACSTNNPLDYVPYNGSSTTPATSTQGLVSTSTHGERTSLSYIGTGTVNSQSQVFAKWTCTGRITGSAPQSFACTIPQTGLGACQQDGRVTARTVVADACTVSTSVADDMYTNDKIAGIKFHSGAASVVGSNLVGAAVTDTSLANSTWVVSASISTVIWTYTLDCPIGSSAGGNLGTVDVQIAIDEMCN